MKKITSIIQVNSNYVIKTEEKDGDPYIVVPVTMMVEGVHNGSHGAIFHSIAELGRLPDSWNGIPITILHPVEDGVFISANHPDQQIVGRVYNTTVENNKLKAEAWLNIEQIQNISPEAFTYIQQGKPLEISLGMFNDHVITTGQWNNESYIGIANNYIPDHLALLPNEEGACSWVDGCGIRNNNKLITNINIMTEKKKIIKDYIKKGTLIIENIISADFLTNEAGYKTIIMSLQGKLDAMDTDNSSYYLEELYSNTFVYRVVNETNLPKFYRRAYILHADNNIEITGEPAEVQKEINYNTKIITNLKKERNTKMKKEIEAKVTELISNSGTRFVDCDKIWLSDLTLENLEQLNPVKVRTQKTVEKEITPEVLKETISGYDVSKMIELFPEAIQKQVKDGISVLTAQKAEVVKSILSNTKDVWTEEVLNKMEIETLTGIKKSIPSIPDVTDYSGQGGGGVVEVKDSEEEGMFPLEAIEAQKEKNN